MEGTYPATHNAVVTTGKRTPLSIKQVDTASPGPGEVVIRVQWTASSPLNLHQADGGLLAPPPFILGDSFAGVVVATGPEDPSAIKPNSAPVQIGDQVAGFAWEKQKQAGFQAYLTVPRHLIGRIPSNLSLPEAVTAPSSLTCALHTITKDLKLDLPWPRHPDWIPRQEKEPILVWGAASSVGLFVVQVLNHWGYRNVMVVASGQHHETLKSFGATKCFDYKEDRVTDKILTCAPVIHHIVDCIGHLNGTLRPLSKIAVKNTKVAIMMPVILRDSTDEIEPELSMDPSALLRDRWAKGVELIGVRTFFFEQNEFFKWHLEPDILPTLLGTGAVKPSRTRIVGGETLLERAQTALNLLRQRAPRGERLVWKVSE